MDRTPTETDASDRAARLTGTGTGTGVDPGEGSAPATGSVVSAIPVPALVLDEEGSVLQVNEAVEERLGYSPSTLTGESIERLCPDLSPGEITGSCRDGSPGGTRLEARGVDADGEDVWLESTFDVLVEDPRRYVVVVHELTRYRDRIQTLEPPVIALASDRLLVQQLEWATTC